MIVTSAANASRAAQKEQYRWSKVQPETVLRTGVPAHSGTYRLPPIGSRSDPSGSRSLSSLFSRHQRTGPFQIRWEGWSTTTTDLANRSCNVWFRLLPNGHMKV